ncbi:MAG: hypothetical protein JOZ78_05755 [Chroococcidiopsidaceae cyanobacterium CP_BM_ER_R8_30]|nr:hypothetical protein [Chroococcidiopsidaceae cyanobacterium CP_BM_ER_R8_30]
MVDDLKLQAYELKQALTAFVLDAEGELAEALETYAAAQSRPGYQDRVQQDLIIDSFLIEGKVGKQSPLDLFLENQPDLSQRDHQIVNNWRRSFIGLFAVTRTLTDGFELMNWLSAKHYIVISDEVSRFKEGEILLTRIAPLTDTQWMFFSPCVPMGKLGKPKLAVAIGNFKDAYRSALYSDAPELLEQAWQSVERYHQEFLEFFGDDEITMPGYQLNKKIAKFQEVMTQRRLAAAGVDTSKSLAEVVQEAGIEEEEIQAAAEEFGVDSTAVAQLIDTKSTTNKMVMPKVELPAELRQAEQVTALTHPRWGQMFIPTYTRFKALLESEDWQNTEGSEKLVRYYLENPNINAFIWRRLAQQYPTQLEKVLQTILERPDFQLNYDLDALLQEFNKPIEPELPEIASVPQHLHDLFQEAVAEVNKSKSKSKSKKKTGMGFQ